MKENFANNYQYQYSSNTQRKNLVRSPSNYSLFSSIKNKIFHYSDKAYQKLIKRTEKSKNSFSHYKKINSFINLRSIRLPNAKNNSERIFKINNLKGNKTSRMEVNRIFNIKFNLNKARNKIEEKNINIRKKLYRNNSAGFIKNKE